MLILPKQSSTGPSTGQEVFIPARQGIRVKRQNPGFRSADLLVRSASVFLLADGKLKRFSIIVNSENIHMVQLAGLAIDINS